MNLQQALRLDRNARVAVVGAGGKTTALFQLARDLEPPVVVTTTTHLGSWQTGFADRHWIITRAEDVDRFAGQIEGVTLFTGPEAGDNRLQGLDETALDAVAETASRLGFPVLVEADGSRQKPLKAPGPHEPAVPGWAQQVVVTAGLSGLGQPLDEQHVHRPEQFASISGLAPGEPINEDALARVLSSRKGGLKHVPAGARVSALLNQAARPELAAAAFRIANQIAGSYHSVLVTALSEKRILAVVEPVGGVVLAAGGASRFGSPKVLLPWQDKPLVRHAAEAALDAGLNPVVVVAGADVEGVRRALVGLPVQLAVNTDWKAGQSTSLRAGLNEMPPELGAVLFMLGDQPFITVDVVRALLDRHRQTLAPVVAPRVAGRRANPVLFDRVTFPGLSELQGDTGGRSLFERYKVEYVDWADENLLLDIDTPEDYQKLIGQERAGE